ncbi:putative phosphatidylinositol transfer protein csr1 protein [Phaeoacremonium minimum UCRPA7]|uniref:Putative phosphatidylinositol transfer protein csr1 protein n=1 Tax=Phaeoacremonium minimum (strain UCR-PA7) TaxID=1286976 RepID=R8BRN2_PHAM7|nr:putative phosphatidylinositol transfer protein csr1 protein [Phaeoacremonium minimum UCRPA7]EOO02027.1 putative phosphatidylinositol transfer protein csr1 protein [Phaeoacremonium minimum UCRPA7]
MAAEIPPGRPGNLTPEQEEKLRKLWAAIFQVCGVSDDDSDAAENTNPSTVAEKGPQKSDLGKSEKPKKKRLGMFSRKGNKDTDAESVSSVPASGALTPKEGEDDKYGQTKHFFDTLASQSPETIRATIWSMVKHDHPDALVLRFLRARKWDIEKALVMLVSTMSWRSKDMHVDDDIMKNGEGAAVEAENSGEGEAKKLGHDFMSQIRMGKSFLHGVDKTGRPICVVRVRLHHQGEQCEESLERYTVYIIETARMLLRPPVDTATIIFDMTGFSMANMDYTPVKFMIKCFEANYPESLGSVLVHKAPWIFQGIWKIIRGWLDPVVASKVHFTNNMKDMAEFIAPDRIIKELEGQEDWSYSYVEPVAGENDKLKDTATRDRLLAARELVVKEFEEATLQWIRHPASEKTAAIRAKREAVADKLRDDYWTLDPYLRARSFYDRIGVIKGGTVVPYPEQTASKANGIAAAAPTTSADDVD